MTKEEIHFCKAGGWAKRQIEDELLNLGIVFSMQYDDVTKCGTVIVDSIDFEVASGVVMANCELRGV